jgi:hypothetical protein
MLRIMHSESIHFHAYLHGAQLDCEHKRPRMDAWGATSRPFFLTLGKLRTYGWPEPGMGHTA